MKVLSKRLRRGSRTSLLSRITNEMTILDKVPLSRFLAGMSQWLAMACATCFILSPFPVGILCLIHRSFDYTVYTHPMIIQNWVWPISALTGILAIISAIRVSLYRRKPLHVWIKENPLFFILLFMGLWMLVSTAVTGWNDTMLYGDEKRLRFETIHMQFGYFLILLPAASLLRDNGKKRLLIRLHEAVSLFLVPTSFVLWKTQLTSVFFIRQPSMTGIYSNIDYYGYYLAVSIPLAAAAFVMEDKTPWKLFSLLVVMANSVTLAYNNTMGAWVACIIAMICLQIACRIMKKKWDGQAALIAAVFAICLFVPGSILGNTGRNSIQLWGDITRIAANSANAGKAGSGRWGIWKAGLQLIRSAPLFGIGFEGVQARGIQEIARNTRVHNEFLQYALFYGCPAGVAYLIGCAGVFIRAIRCRAVLRPAELVCLMAAFGYLVSSFFGLTLFATTPFLFLYLGMGYVRSDDPPCDQHSALPPPAAANALQSDRPC